MAYALPWKWIFPESRQAKDTLVVPPADVRGTVPSGKVRLTHPFWN